MTPTITWDGVGERRYETGVDHGVLYLRDQAGAYSKGVPWNGLVSITESPSGAESSPQYADNIKYLNLVSAEEFGATIEAFTYPDEFALCDGTAEPAVGVYVGQQSRRTFGLAYRTRIGNDIDGDDHGYKLHLVYGALAAPSEKARNTVNDSPEAVTFSWELSTTPVEVPNFKPSATLTIDSTKATAAQMKALEDLLYGTATVDAVLPLPAVVIGLFTPVEEPEEGAGAQSFSVESFNEEPTFAALPEVDQTVQSEPVDYTTSTTAGDEDDSTL